MSITHRYKLTHVDWIFEGMEMTAIHRVDGAFEVDRGIEFEFESDGVNPPITLQIVPILEDGKPKLDFVIIRHDELLVVVGQP